MANFLDKVDEDSYTSIHSIYFNQAIIEVIMADLFDKVDKDNYELHISFL